MKPTDPAPSDPRPAAADAAADLPTLFVCVTCHTATETAGAPDVAGRRLFDALTARAAARLGDPPLRIVPVECLSACSHPTAVALARAGRWGYVYGDLGPAQLDEILDGGALYADAADGVVEWRLRPRSFQSGVVARIPPTK